MLLWGIEEKKMRVGEGAHTYNKNVSSQLSENVAWFLPSKLCAVEYTPGFMPGAKVLLFLSGFSLLG